MTKDYSKKQKVAGAWDKFELFLRQKLWTWHWVFFHLSGFRVLWVRNQQGKCHQQTCLWCSNFFCCVDPFYWSVLGAIHFAYQGSLESQLQTMWIWLLKFARSTNKRFPVELFDDSISLFCTCGKILCCILFHNTAWATQKNAREHVITSQWLHWMDGLMICCIRRGMLTCESGSLSRVTSCFVAWLLELSHSVFEVMLCFLI